MSVTTFMTQSNTGTHTVGGSSTWTSISGGTFTNSISSTGITDITSHDLNMSPSDLIRLLKDQDYIPVEPANGGDYKIMAPRLKIGSADDPSVPMSFAGMRITSRHSRVSKAYAFMPGDEIQLNPVPGMKMDLIPGKVSVEFLDHDNFRLLGIEDNKPKVLYQPIRELEFNPYVNTSDRLEEFIRWCAGEVRLDGFDIMNLPLNLFINWLVIEAAEKDGEDTKDDRIGLDRRVNTYAQKALPPPVKHLPTHAGPFRCLGCGQFLHKVNEQNQIPFCKQEHLLLFHNRRKALLPAA